MPDGESKAQVNPVKLPWFGTVILFVAVMVAALVRPLMPHGIVEYVLRLAGRPLSIDIGHGKFIRLVEEEHPQMDCQTTDLAWSPDGNILVTACSESLRAQSLDGNEIGKGPSPWPSSRHMQVLTNPFRLVYFGQSKDPSVRDPNLTVWDVQAGRSSTLPIEWSPIDDFGVDPDHDRVAVAHLSRQDVRLDVLALESGKATQTLQLSTAVCSMRWLPGAQALLLGGCDGVLRLADMTTGEIRELARPYTTVFPTGGSASGWVDGLVLSPDSKSVAIFKTGGGITPAPAAGTINMKTGQKWEESLGTTVEIRSIDDGRLLDRMPGPETGVVGLVWDPRDRFIAVAGRDALIIWQRKNGELASRTYEDPGIPHTLSLTNDGTRLALTTGRGVRIFQIQEH
jgi:WD40 repeat protein